MKTLYVLFCVCIFGQQSIFAEKLFNKNPADYLAVQTRNKQIAVDLIKGDVGSLSRLYTVDCSYLPEFGPTINGRVRLSDFYRTWLKNSRIITYSKSIYEVEPISNYLLETGNLTIHYKMGLDADREYRGKYMVIWKRDQAGQINIYAEAFGADHQVDVTDVPYPAGDVSANQPTEDFMVRQTLKPALQDYDKKVVSGVVAGDGASRAAGFTNDGIYMPHFDPMQIGMKAIRPYMLKTYYPHTISYVKDTFRELFDTGEFILLTGHFHVILNNPGKTSFDGNMLNLMKRGNDGKLLMYRQLAHN